MKIKAAYLFVFVLIIITVISGCSEKKNVFPADKSKSTVTIEIFDPYNKVIVNQTVGITDNTTVFDVTKYACLLQNKVVDYTGFGKTVYIKGIDGIKQLAYGPDSGWVYSVNDSFANANKSCGAYILKDKDIITWYYTKNGGSDVGATFG